MGLRPGGRLTGLSRRRRIFVVASSLIVAVLVLLAGLQAAGAFSTGPATPGGGRPGVVVLVPGYGGSTAGVDVLAAHIQAAGLRTHVLRLPGDGMGDLNAQADALNAYVASAERSGAGLVDIIGYSAGGVVTRLWDIEDNGARRASKIITLGSPLHGTRIAAAGNAADPSACPLACQELVPGSALLARLRGAPASRQPAWLSLWSENDQVVRPPDSARLAGAVNLPLQSVCHDLVVQHGQLPTSPLVIGIVLRALRPGPLTAPTQADCPALEALGGGGPGSASG